MGIKGPLKSLSQILHFKDEDSEAKTVAGGSVTPLCRDRAGPQAPGSRPASLAHAVEFSPPPCTTFAECLLAPRSEPRQTLHAQSGGADNAAGILFL